MIWKSEHIINEGKNAPIKIQHIITQNGNYNAEKKGDFTIGIIGGGPKGMYALEELMRQYKTQMRQEKLRIFWWNKSVDFGSGPNYRTTQPDFLLINYCIGHIDAWDRTNGNHPNELNFVQWLEENKNNDVEVQPTDYASRALVGLYLQNMLLKTCQSKPETIELFLIDDEVSDIHINSENNILVQDTKYQLIVDHLLLATGHCYQNKPLLKVKEHSIPKNYYLSAYPIEQLQEISEKKKVGIIGWGLTFIDVALALTEGRGGHFDAQGNYRASGKEPMLLPFSRNQIPILPRGPIYGKEIYKLKYIDQKWLEELKRKSNHQKIDFIKDIFPLLEQELRFAYYSTLLQSRDDDSVEQYIQALPEDQRFSYEALLFPKLTPLSSVQDTYLNYLDFWIEEAEKGELKSPLMAAAAVWREASTYMAELYQGGGFTGESQHYFDQNLFGAFCRTSYGPPIENMKKMRALLKAGIIQTNWLEKVELQYIEHENSFQISSKQHKVKADYIIDARIARPDLQSNNSHLYQKMYENHLVEPFENQGYLPGCVDLNSKGKINHSKNYNIYLYGSNTEGFLLDNDSLSRKKNNLAKSWANDVLAAI